MEAITDATHPIVSTTSAFVSSIAAVTETPSADGCVASLIACAALAMSGALDPTADAALLIEPVASATSEAASAVAEGASVTAEGTKTVVPNAWAVSEAIFPIAAAAWLMTGTPSAMSDTPSAIGSVTAVIAEGPSLTTEAAYRIADAPSLIEDVTSATVSSPSLSDPTPFRFVKIVVIALLTHFLKNRVVSCVKLGQIWFILLYPVSIFVFVVFLSHIRVLMNKGLRPSRSPTAGD